jgi:hypothetical protein
MRLSIENAAAGSGVVLFWRSDQGWPRQRNFATMQAAKRYAHGRWGDGIVWCHQTVCRTVTDYFGVEVGDLPDKHAVAPTDAGTDHLSRCNYCQGWHYADLSLACKAACEAAYDKLAKGGA